MEEYILLENMFTSSSSSSSTDSDDNNEALQNILFDRNENNRNERRVVPKINNYIEHVVIRYTNIL